MQVPRRERKREREERQLRQECPAPADGVGEDPADEGAADGGDGHDGTHDAHVLAAFEGADDLGEHDLAEGADIAIYSGHKFLSGPTSGIVAGRKDLVRAAYLQNRGIARGMKVGKESVAGAMAALMPIVGPAAAVRIARGAMRRPAWRSTRTR